VWGRQHLRKDIRYYKPARCHAHSGRRERDVIVNVGVIMSAERLDRGITVVVVVIVVVHLHAGGFLAGQPSREPAVDAEIDGQFTEGAGGDGDALGAQGRGLVGGAGGVGAGGGVGQHGCVVWCVGGRRREKEEGI